MKQQTRIKRLLEKQLEREEVQAVIRVWRAQEHGETHSGGHLGFCASLERRGWLVRDPDGNLRLNSSTRLLLAEFCQSDSVGFPRVESSGGNDASSEGC